MSALIAGLVCGVLSGLGVGGGTVLMVWMTAVMELPQWTAQGINLLYFLPTALCALLLHAKHHLICWRVVLPAAIAGSAAAVAGAWLATALDTELLRRLFGCFLLLVGATELLYRSRERKER